MRNIQFILIAICGLVVFGCSPSDGNFQGNEYMPDMGHSVAYEANYYDYYRYNRWGSEEDYHKMAQPRKPVKGTIPRGFAGAGASSSKLAMIRGANSLNAIAVTPNGNVPYYYEDTEAERTRAMAEIINNPYAITTEGLARGKNLYDIFCGICHGSKGGGNGLIYDTDANPLAKYPAAPANLISEEFISATNGRYYHAIMHGKNVMGGYSDKMSYEERWQVIHYIRSLQAKSNKTEYTQTANTLGGGGRPAGANYKRDMTYNPNEASTNVAPSGGSRRSGNNGVGQSRSYKGGTQSTTTSSRQRLNLSQGNMQGGHSGDHSTGTTHMQDGGAVSGAAGAAGAVIGEKKKGKVRGFLNKTGDKLKKGGGKLKDGTKKVGGKLKDRLKKKNGGL